MPKSVIKHKKPVDWTIANPRDNRKNLRRLSSKSVLFNDVFRVKIGLLSSLLHGQKRKRIKKASAG